MPRMTKAERAAQERRQARNARRQERRRGVTSARQQFNQAYANQARRMGLGTSGQSSPRETARVVRAMGNRGAEMMRNARITSTRGGTLEVGANE